MRVIKKYLPWILVALVLILTIQAIILDRKSAKTLQNAAIIVLTLSLLPFISKQESSDKEKESRQREAIPFFKKKEFRFRIRRVSQPSRDRHKESRNQVAFLRSDFPLHLRRDPPFDKHFIGVCIGSLPGDTTAIVGILDNEIRVIHIGKSCASYDDFQSFEKLLENKILEHNIWGRAYVLAHNQKTKKFLEQCKKFEKDWRYYRGDRCMVWNFEMNILGVDLDEKSVLKPTPVGMGEVPEYADGRSIFYYKARHFIEEYPYNLPRKLKKELLKIREFPSGEEGCLKVETREEFKKEHGYFPNIADAFVVAVSAKYGDYEKDPTA